MGAFIETRMSGAFWFRSSFLANHGYENCFLKFDRLSILPQVLRDPRVRDWGTPTGVFRKCYRDVVQAALDAGQLVAVGVGHEHGRAERDGENRGDALDQEQRRGPGTDLTGTPGIFPRASTGSAPSIVPAA